MNKTNKTGTKFYSKLKVFFNHKLKTNNRKLNSVPANNE